MNMIFIAGHLGADPEARFTQSGKKVTTINVATRTRRGSKDGTIWWRVTIWENQFEKMIPYLKKGSAIMVWGEVHEPRIFEDREKRPRVSLEITAIHMEFSPFGKPGGRTAEEGAQNVGPSQPSSPASSMGSFPDPMASVSKMGAPSSPQPQGETFDDEVPF